MIEAAKNSGALITADFALEQGKEVFAVPGSVNSATSFGTNQLIKQGAKLVDSVEDIIEEIRPEFGNLIRKIPVCRPEPGLEAKEVLLARGHGNKVLSEDEKKVHNLLDSRKASCVDEITEGSGLPSAKVMSILLRLEISKLIKQLPGKMFIRQ